MVRVQDLTQEGTTEQLDRPAEAHHVAKDPTCSSK